MGKAFSKFACCDRYESESGSDKGHDEDCKRNITDFSPCNSLFSDSSSEHVSLLTVSSVGEDEAFLLPYGFTFVQKYVGEGNLRLLREALMEPHNLNTLPCSFPLHIACVNGNLPCAELLIRHGANVNVEAPMCWPRNHSLACLGRLNPGGNPGRLMQYSPVRCPVQVGRDRPLDAYQYAIAYDHDKILKFLMSRLVCDEPICKDKPFIEEAIERESPKCCEFLMETRMNEVEACYFRSRRRHGVRDGSSSFLHVLLLMARKPAHFTSDVCRSFLRNSVALARNDYPTVAFEEKASNQSKKGQGRGTKESKRKQNQPWQTEEMKAVVTLLLQTAAGDYSRVPGPEFLRRFLYKIYDMSLRFELEEFMENDLGSVKNEDENEDKELKAMLRSCLNQLSEIDSFSDFDEKTKDRFINCLKILYLYENGVNGRGRSTPQRFTPFHLLIFSASENMTLIRQESKIKNFAYIKNVMLLLFKLGMDPTKGARSDSPNILYGVLEMCKNSSTVEDLELVYELILTLLQHGINPDEKLRCLDLLRSHYGRSNPFVTRNSCYLLEFLFIILAKKGHLLVESKSTFSRILYLFYLSMNHNDLFECLEILHLQQDKVAFDCPSYNLVQVIQDMLSHPRSLKQIARVSIYKSMNRKPGFYANSLPLPSTLQDYIKTFEP